MRAIHQPQSTYASFGMEIAKVFGPGAVCPELLTSRSSCPSCPARRANASGRSDTQTNTSTHPILCLPLFPQNPLQLPPPSSPNILLAPIPQALHQCPPRTRHGPCQPRRGGAETVAFAESRGGTSIGLGGVDAPADIGPAGRGERVALRAARRCGAGWEARGERGVGRGWVHPCLYNLAWRARYGVVRGGLDGI